MYFVVFLAALGYRLLNAALIGSYFNPDEYWQGPEVAHNWVFGVGALTWEWQGDAPIRTVVHPALYAGPLYFLQCVGLDSSAVIAATPYIVHAVLLAFQDLAVLYASMRWCRGSQKVAFIALALHGTSWFVYYAGIRPFSNSVESALTMVALAFWPSNSSRSGVPAMAFASLACVLRPSAAVFWAVVASFWVLQSQSVRHMLEKMASGLLVAGAVQGVALVADWSFFGFWTWPALNFVRFNVIAGLSHLYGAHPWHWYLTQGLPATTFGCLLLCVCLLPLAGWGVARRATAEIVPLPVALAAATQVVSLSIPAHKEFRFLLPLLPIVTIATAPLVARALEGNEDRDTSKRTERTKCGRNRVARWVVVAYLVTQVAAVLLLGRLHQRGPVAVMHEFRQRVDRHWNNVAGGTASPGFRLNGCMLMLAGCHAAPFFSVVHHPVDMVQLDCKPWARLHPNGSTSDRFLANPARFLDGDLFPNGLSAPDPPAVTTRPVGNWSWERGNPSPCAPSHIALFSNTWETLYDRLQDAGYDPVFHAPHSLISWLKVSQGKDVSSQVHAAIEALAPHEREENAPWMLLVEHRSWHARSHPPSPRPDL